MKKLCVVCLFCVVTFLPGQVLASPLFSLNSFAEWDAAVGTTVLPVTEAYDALAAYSDLGYGTLGVNYVYVTPQIVAATAAASGEPDDGLVMTWGNTGVADDVLQVAAWEYTYGVDPDLTGKTLHLNVTPPTGILAVSLTINDINGGWASWIWTVAPTLIAGVANPITIDPTLLVNQMGSASFTQSAFDVTKVTSIQADELAVGSALWNTNFPTVPVVGGSQPWNYWSTLQVTPEPMSLSLLALGSLAVLRRHRHK